MSDPRLNTVPSNSYNSLPAAHIHSNERQVKDAAIDFTRLLAMAFVSLDTQIAIADTKSQIIIGANTILIASLGLNQDAIIGMLTGDTSTLGQQLGAGLMLIMAVILMASVYYALAGSRPNLRQPQPGTTVPAASGGNLFFFGHVASMTQTDFEAAFLDQTMEEVKQDVAAQIHAKSVIVTRKYRMINISLRLLFLALFVWLFSRMVLVIG